MQKYMCMYCLERNRMAQLCVWGVILVEHRVPKKL